MRRDSDLLSQNAEFFMPSFVRVFTGRNILQIESAILVSDGEVRMLEDSDVPLNLFLATTSKQETLWTNSSRIFPRSAAKTPLPRLRTPRPHLSASLDEDPS